MNRLIACLCLLATLSVGQARAQTGAPSGGVRISPVMLEIARERRATSFRIENSGAAPRSFAVEAQAWRQDDGRDVLSPTEDLIVTPSVFEAAPGRAQIVRVALSLGRSAPGPERAYRLILTEIGADTPENGVRLRLQVSLPLFTRTGDAPAGALAASRTDDGVRIVNVGATHVRLAEIFAGDAPLEATPRYLLAGESFVRRAPSGAVRARFTANDGAPVEQVLIDAPAWPLRH